MTLGVTAEPRRSGDQTGTILEALNEVFRDVFGDNVHLTRSTVAKDVDGWDSLTHISLILAIEEYFDIKFAVGETERAKNIGDLVDWIHLRTRKG